MLPHILQLTPYIFLILLLFAALVYWVGIPLIFEFDWKGRRSKSVITDEHRKLFKPLLKKKP